MEKKLMCPVCKLDYSDTRTPRLIPTCGHTLCQSCIKQRIIADDERDIYIVCPQDGKITSLEQNDFRCFPKNFAMLKLVSKYKAQKNKSNENAHKLIPLQKKDLIEQDKQQNPILILKQNNQISQKQMVQSYQQKQNIQNNSKNQINKTNSILSHQQSSKTISSIEQKQEVVSSLNSKKQLLIQKNIEQLQNMCLIHSKPLQIICIQDRTKICSSCAIFGDHRGHDFKTIDQFQKDKLNQCDKILQILQIKQKTQQQINKQLSLSTTKQIMKQIKQHYIKQIKQNYTKLSQCLLLSLKRSLSKLQQVFDQIQQKIQKVKYNSEIFRKYQSWQKQAYINIQIFQSNNIQQQISVLSYTNIQNNSVQLGDKILEEMVSECDNVISQRNRVLDCCKIIYDKDMINKIENYCYITFKQQQKYSKNLILSRKLSNPNNIHINVIPAILIQTEKQQPIQTQKIDYYLSRTQRSNTQKPYILLQSDTNQDYLLQQLNNSRQNNIYERSFEHISSIDNLSREASRQLSISQTIQTSFMRGSMISGVKSPTAATKRITIKQKKIKLNQKYQKVYDAILNDTSEIIDLTGAELGDQTILQMLQSVQGTKCKTIKLIRNKITDDCLNKLWRYFGNVVTLNLSQNLLTQKSIESLLNNIHLLPNLRSISISQNKIKQRSIKAKIEEIKKMDIIVSL